MSDERRANHLAGQTSPYLLQHLHNPVDWYPWGDEALARSRRENRPIFLSIGYAACHWCHVMERESFEDPRIAELLNGHYVSIKVDREERPDIDEIYMNAVQLMTGQGGWPLTVFLMPDLRPFWGGTYFPPDDRHGRPGFAAVLLRIHELWSAERDKLERSAGELTGHLQRIADGPREVAGEAAVGPDQTARAAAELTRRFDGRWGGFSPAPKFPPDGAIGLLLREHLRTGERVPLDMAETTLDRMALGGMYDHVGGGFARYSVDERWLVPHFEKMLYNQALLVPCYVDAWRVSGKQLHRRVVEQTLDFVRRELAAPDGGLYSSLDADSEGEEGRFYVWRPEEIDAALGVADGALVRELYGIDSAGNFEGRSIPNLLEGDLAERAAARGESEPALAERLEPLLARLLEVRERRPRPATDDKILTAWNGLTISACCRAHQAFGRARDLATARGAAGFIAEHLERDGRLLVSWRAGRARLNAYLDDYAFLIRGLIDLYETDFDVGHLERAQRLAETLAARFEDRASGGFFFTSDDHETLLTRNHSLHDGALPAGSGVATEALLRLSRHLDREDFRRVAERALTAYRGLVERMPSAYGALLLSADLADRPPCEVAIVGPPEDPATLALLAEVRRRPGPSPIVQLGGADDERLPLLRGRRMQDGRPTAFVCRSYACREPTSDPATLRTLLAEA